MIFTMILIDPAGQNAENAHFKKNEFLAENGLTKWKLPGVEEMEWFLRRCVCETVSAIFSLV